MTSHRESRISGGNICSKGLPLYINSRVSGGNIEFKIFPLRPTSTAALCGISQSQGQLITFWGLIITILPLY
ncbi:MAG: hypothetical protein GX587_11355 [Bacteroidales bacterium]|nr:hypothetical protein [Bacteroidales bacterium]